MAIQMRTCKVCGKEYAACPTAHRNNSAYRWQDVACCKEHGDQYLHDIMVSRGMIADDATAVEETVVETADTAVDTTVGKKTKKREKA